MSRPGVTVAAARRVEVREGRLLVPSAGIDVVVGPRQIVVGRDPSCSIVVPNRHVSAVHAELFATERGVRLRDLSSRNGTWVGDVSIAEAFLTGTVRLSFGEVEATFEAAGRTPVAMARDDRLGPLFGTSTSMRQLFEQVRKLAPTDLTALILGETGTGKELVAQAIHRLSDRAKKPFIVVDCGAIPPSLAESILFGHERGAFTGASERRESPFVQAAGGTVFLDELGELPLEIQPKLLRALAERRVQPVGASSYKSFDARIVAATRQNLLAMVNEGSFRSDLYFRIAQVKLELEPLRARADDIPGLVADFLKQGGASGAIDRVSRETMARLLRHDWPGNVRELKNAVVVALALAESDGPLDIAAHVGMGSLSREHARPEVFVEGNGAAEMPTYHEAKRVALARFEREYFSRMLEACEGSVVQISRRADLQRAHVRRYLRAHGLTPTRRRRAPEE